MNFQLWVIGKTQMPFVKEGVNEFSKRINRYYPFEIVTFSAQKSKDSKIVKQKEAEEILRKIPHGAHVILLDERGKSYGSIEFANSLQKLFNQSKKHIIFIVGGAFGFDQILKDRANSLLSLSKMTYSHQLIRLIFCEQLYRACTIIKGEKYHNE